MAHCFDLQRSTGFSIELLCRTLFTVQLVYQNVMFFGSHVLSAMRTQDSHRVVDIFQFKFQTQFYGSYVTVSVTEIMCYWTDLYSFQY